MTRTVRGPLPSPTASATTGASRFRRLATTAALPLVLLLGACSSSDEAETSDGADLERFHDQELTFGPCADYAMTALDDQVFTADDSFECARMEVPLDYDDADGETVQIAMLRVPARGEPIGSLVVNPGGPGGAGMVQAATTSVVWAESPITEKFDIVGFDPRGVGASTPAMSCATDEELDRDEVRFTLLGSEGAWTADDTQALVDRCAAGSGGEEVLAHLGTRDQARDMDVLREVLGDDELTFAGQSYGTRLGALYAEMFPENVRAMVLDGAVDPTQGSAERLVSQYTGFQRSFDLMAADCASRDDCPLGPDPNQAAEVFHDIVRPLIDQPVPAGDGRELTFNLATGSVLSGLYSSANWPAITAGIADIEAGDGSTLLKLYDDFSGRGDGRWSNFSEANYAIGCMDEQRRSPEEEADLRQQLFEAAPFLDPGQGVEGSRSACESWPAEPTLDFPYADQVEGLPDTLTISITGDPSTPFEAGENLADSLGGAVLTVEGEQHTVAMGGASECVNDVVADYLIELTSPEPDQRCRL